MICEMPESGFLSVKIGELHQVLIHTFWHASFDLYPLACKIHILKANIHSLRHSRALVRNPEAKITFYFDGSRDSFVQFERDVCVRACMYVCDEKGVHSRYTKVLPRSFEYLFDRIIDKCMF
jgi:hypothetical protein